LDEVEAQLEEEFLMVVVSLLLIAVSEKMPSVSHEVMRNMKVPR